MSYSYSIVLFILHLKLIRPKDIHRVIISPVSVSSSPVPRFFLFLSDVGDFLHAGWRLNSLLSCSFFITFLLIPKCEMSPILSSSHYILRSLSNYGTKFSILSIGLGVRIGGQPIKFLGSSSEPSAHIWPDFYLHKNRLRFVIDSFSDRGVF